MQADSDPSFVSRILCCDVMDSQDAQTQIRTMVKSSSLIPRIRFSRIPNLYILDGESKCCTNIRASFHSSSNLMCFHFNCRNLIPKTKGSYLHFLKTWYLNAESNSNLLLLEEYTLRFRELTIEASSILRVTCRAWKLHLIYTLK